MISELLNMVFFSNTLKQYLVSIGIFLASILVVMILRSIVVKKLKTIAQKTVSKVDDFFIRIVQRTVMPLLYLGAFYFSLQPLVLPNVIVKVMHVLVVAILTIMAIRFLVSLINFFLLSFNIKGAKDDAREKSLKGVASVIKIIVWGGGIVFLLDNLGFKVSAIIAGLGIGGIAVGLAAQAILGDVFSFFAILFDRPFEVGDFIIIGDYLGSIEQIGMKTTRIRSLGGEQLIFSNTDLTNSRVRNYKRMYERRVVFKLGVTYQTPQEQMGKIPKIIKKIIEDIKEARFDRAHFCAYGDFSLNIEIVYYALTPDYNKYMDIQQQINLAIMQEFKKEKIEFAYPTQTVFLNKD
ncbi:MAG: mechanosensitive ion channel family protein [Candidatus Omnitrophica bacterium]|nr:mechanosensitive ion channel family protein [Candidatus Omnitrophota bacterium]